MGCCFTRSTLSVLQKCCSALFLALKLRAQYPNFLPSLSLGDELKCSTPRAQRTGSTMHWKDVYMGLAEMLSPADGLVGDLLTVSFLATSLSPDSLDGVRLFCSVSA